MVFCIWIEKINYDELSPKLEQETLSDKEREEFLELNDKMENYSAERLKLLLQLAGIREISLPQVMEQLGLQKPTYV